MKKDERGALWMVMVNLGLCLVFGGMMIYYAGTGKARLIVRAHYSGWRIRMICLGIALLVSLGWLGFHFLRLRRLKRKRRGSEQNRLKREQVKPANAKQLRTPEEIYRYVSDLLDEDDSLARRRILAQLDMMNALQERLTDLLEMNDSVSSLRETQDLLQDIENAICLNVKKAINFRIAGGSQVFANKLVPILRENEKLLDDSEGILLDLAEFLNNGRGSVESISRKIKDYRQIIREFLKEEQEDDAEESGRDDFGSGSGLRARGV